MLLIKSQGDIEYYWDKQCVFAKHKGQWYRENEHMNLIPVSRFLADSLENERCKIIERDLLAKAQVTWEGVSSLPSLNRIGDPMGIITHYLSGCYTWPLMITPPSREVLLTLPETGIDVTDIAPLRSNLTLSVYSGIILCGQPSIASRIAYDSIMSSSFNNWYVGNPSEQSVLPPFGRLHSAILDAAVQN